MTTSPEQKKLIDAEGLLEALFEEQARPSLRWIREQQRKRTIPFIRVGRLVRFDLDQVRAAMNSQFTIHARKGLER